METSIHPRISRGRGSGVIDAAGVRTLPSKNKQWVPDQGGNRVSAHSESERWERGGHYAGRSRGSMRGTRKFQNVSLTRTPRELGGDYKGESHDVPVVEDPDPSTPDEREKFYQEVCAMRNHDTPSNLPL
jgi:hypothetical protein